MNLSWLNSMTCADSMKLTRFESFPALGHGFLARWWHGATSVIQMGQGEINKIWTNKKVRFWTKLVCSITDIIIYNGGDALASWSCSLDFRPVAPILFSGAQVSSPIEEQEWGSGFRVGSLFYISLAMLRTQWSLSFCWGVGQFSGWSTLGPGQSGRAGTSHPSGRLGGTGRQGHLGHFATM